MGDQSLELQILNYINSKNGRAQDINIKAIETKIDELEIPGIIGQEKDDFKKAKDIAKAWINPFGESTIVKEKIPEFLHLWSSIDDGAEYHNYDTRDNISERALSEAFSEAKGDLKNINEGYINAFQLTGSSAPKYKSIQEGILMFSQKIRTLVECIFSAVFLGTPPKGDNDWNDGTLITGGTKTLEEANKRKIDEVLTIDKTKSTAAEKPKEIKNTTIDKTVWRFGEITLDKSDLEIEDDSKTIEAIRITKIHGGQLFKRERNFEATEKISQNHVLNHKDFLDLPNKPELVFKPDKESTKKSTSATLEFTVTKKDRTVEKRTVKITVREATSGTEGKANNTETAGTKKKEAKTIQINHYRTEASTQERETAGITQNVAGTTYPEYSSTIAAQYKLINFNPTLMIDGFWGDKTQTAFEDWKAGAANDDKLLAEGEVNKYGVMFDTEFASVYSSQATTKAQVQKIQKFLKIEENGNYDKATVAKVKEFQQQNGLTPDGIWGPITTAKAMSLNTNPFPGF